MDRDRVVAGSRPTPSRLTRGAAGIGCSMIICTAVLTIMTACGVIPARSPSATPRSAPSPSASPSQVATPNAGWKVHASNVGLAPLGLSCGSLPRYTGGYRVPHGSRISGMLITTGLDLSEGDIIIERSCIQPTSAGPGMPVLSTFDYNTMRVTNARVVIRNSELDGSKLARKSAAMTAAFIGIADLYSNYIHGFGSGIGLMNTGTSLDATIERNYVTGLIAWGDPAKDGNHSDAFTIRDFSAADNPRRKAVVRNNRFNEDSGNDSGALFLQTYSGEIDNVLIDGNLLEGNNYQLQLGMLNHPYSNVRAVDNRMSGTGFGPLNVQGGVGFSEFSQNCIFDSRRPDACGQAIGG